MTRDLDLVTRGSVTNKPIHVHSPWRLPLERPPPSVLENKNLLLGETLFPASPTFLRLYLGVAVAVSLSQIIRASFLHDTSHDGPV